MLNLVSGATTYFADPTTPKAFLGRFISPRSWTSIDKLANSGYIWAADNDCFQRLDRNAYLLMLRRLSRTNLTNFKFVAIPDIPFDGKGSLARYRIWWRTVAYYGLPKAFVVQNGSEALELPWDTFEALFVGGDTKWKLSLAAAKLVKQAKDNGKWVHMGRVNSNKRIEYAMSIGVDSYDGTGYSKFPNAQIPLSVRTAAKLAHQPGFFGAINGHHSLTPHADQHQCFGACLPRRDRSGKPDAEPAAVRPVDDFHQQLPLHWL